MRCNACVACTVVLARWILLSETLTSCDVMKVSAALEAQVNSIGCYVLECHVHARVCCKDAMACTAQETLQCQGRLSSCLQWMLPWFSFPSRLFVTHGTKRRSSRACIGNPKPEQETINGTHAQETSAYQRRPSTQHAAQGSNPPIRAPYMQLAKIPHRLPPVPQAQTSTAPTAGATGTIPAHTQLKTRRRGNSLAPKNTSRH